MIRKCWIVFFSLWLTTSFCNAQIFIDTPNPDFAQLEEIELWTGPTEFEATTIPDKWKGESAVILAIKSQEFYTKPSFGYYQSYNIYRHRVKLLDKAAIENYSTLYFTANDILGVRIYKEDGSFKEIEVVGVEYGVENEGFNSQQLKFAIPDLEIGDIYDYYFIQKSSGFMPVISDPTIFTFNDDEYPILYQEFEWIMHKNFLMNIKLLNSESTIEETYYGKSGSEISGPSGSEFYKIKTAERNAEKKESKRYDSEYVILPTIEYRITSKTKESKRSPYYIKNVSVFRETPPKEKLVKYLNHFIKSDEFDEDSKIILELIESYDRTLVRKSDSEEVKIKKYNEAYYALRHYYFNPNTGDQSRLNYSYEGSNLEYYRNEFAGDDHGAPNYYSYLENDYPSYIQTIIMGQLLDELGIEFEVFVSVPRNLGDIHAAIMEEELSFGLIAKISENKKFYFTGMDRYTDPYVQDYSLEGTKIIIIDPNGKKGNYREDVFPVSDYKNHLTFDKIDLSFDVDSNQATITKEISAYGLHKGFESKRNLFISDYFISDWLKYNEDYKPYPENLTQRRKLDIQKAIEEKNVQKEDWRIKLQENYLEEDFSLIRMEHYEILDRARNNDGPFNYKATFVVDDLSAKANGNYIIQVGRLIGGQVALRKNEYKRDIPAYIEHPKQYINELTFDIPDGYYIDDYSDLEFDIDNEAGSFKTEVSMDGTHLKYKTTKIYKTNYLTKDQWPLMVEFLDAAYDFTQKKIVLKKKKES